MIILTSREQVADLTDSHLQQLVEQRIQCIEECCPWDVNELGPIIIVEPGDTASQLEAVMGFSILEGLLEDTRFGDSDFSPAFEFAELHGDDGKCGGVETVSFSSIFCTGAYGNFQRSWSSGWRD